MISYNTKYKFHLLIFDVVALHLDNSLNSLPEVFNRGM